MAVRESKSITAQNEWTAELRIVPNQRASVSITGTGWTSTVTLQRRFVDNDGSVTSWADVESWSAIIETTYVADGLQEIRLGVDTGDFGSGTVPVEIGAG